MAETLTIRTASSTEVVKISSQGPQGPKGDKGDPGDVAGLPLSTQGDILYRGASENQRLPIGTTGQVLKVSGGIPEWANESGAVSSVAGKTGIVTLDKNDVGLGNVANAAQVTSVTGTAPIVSSGGTTPAISISAATTSAAGSMSAADKTKLDGIAAGAEVNVNADWNASSGDAQILNKPTLGGAAALNVGTTTGTVAAGDDARLSDSRTPTAHAASHASAGSDPLFDQDLNTNSLVSFDAVTVNDNLTFNGELGLIFGSQDGATATRASLGLGTAATADIGTGSTEVAAGDHGHGNITSDGKLGSVSGLPVVTTTAGAVTTLALGTAGQVLTVNGTADGVEFAAASGGGSGGTKTYAVFTATDNQPPATAFATLDTRNSIAVLDFDDATDESAVFVSIIPEGASLGSGLKIRLHWMATTATSGNVVWDVSLERMNTDLDTDSFDTIASGTAAASGTSGILTVTEITLTTIDSVTAGDGFRLKVTRDANNASDTMTGDAELVLCEVRSAA